VKKSDDYYVDDDLLYEIYRECKRAKYDERNMLGENLEKYYYRFKYDRRKELIALYEFYMKAPSYVEQLILNEYQGMYSFECNDMDISNVLKYNYLQDIFKGFVSVGCKLWNNSGGLQAKRYNVSIFFRVNMSDASIRFVDVQIKTAP